MKKNRHSRHRGRGKRGSALLVSLMVIVGLSLLGLGFVAVSETESKIANNEENALQTQSIAEAGAMLVVEWYQNPSWAITNAALPKNNSTNPNLAAIKTVRSTITGGGVYKPDPQTLLFDVPYRPDPPNRLYGDEDHADITINRTTDATTIDNFNNVLLGPNASDKLGGEVSEIKVYAPPIVGATLKSGFWDGGTRYGTATIKVTATRYRDATLADPAKSQASNILASHAVRLVIGPIPLPIPGGPIQSNTAIAFNGDFVVHWGNETSTGSLVNKRDANTVPWANAFEVSHFEHGYEPYGNGSLSAITIANGGSGYTPAQNGATVTIGAAPAGGTNATATMIVANGQVTGVTIGNYGKGYYSQPGQTGWGPSVTFPAPAGGGTTATGYSTVGAEAWPITGGRFEDAAYFQEILNKTLDDPWFGSRAVGSSNGPGCSAGTVSPQFAQCTPYQYTSAEGSGDASHFFQWQSTNLYPWQKLVLFPTIKYDFWKKITSQNRGMKGLYYFSYDGSGGFKKSGSGASQSICTWVNTQTNNLGPGVYFFDTANGQNPQGVGATGTLTPAESFNSACMGGNFLMVGFVYINASSYGTSGVGSSETIVNNAAFPGEHFRDIGYPKLDKSCGPPYSCAQWDTTCGGAICRAGIADSAFSYDDLNGNGVFDVVTMPAPKWYSYDAALTTHNAGSTYIIKTWKSPAQATRDYGAPCTMPGTNPATDCSEPHEPYLNYIYPTSRSTSITVGWEASNSQTRNPKKTGVTCTNSSSQDDCTSNAYDGDGALVTDMNTILDGVLYNEGDYSSTGNADYFGSLLIQGTVNGTGTPDIWFDEKLLKGTWAPPGMPRVMIYSVATDEMAQP